MNSYAIFLDLNTDEPTGAFRYDGKTTMIVGDESEVDTWFEYFSDPGELWSAHRTTDDPFGMLFGDGRSSVKTFAPGEGDDEFAQAFMQLNGKKIRVVDHEAKNDGK